MGSLDRDRTAPRRAVVRLVVGSPDGRRVLARPNGLAGWILPAIPAHVPLTDWGPEAAERATAIIGTPVEPVRRLAPDAWAVHAPGRISAAGTTWIAIEDAARLGADEAIVRQWATTEDRGGEATQSDSSGG